MAEIVCAQCRSRQPQPELEPGEDTVPCSNCGYRINLAAGRRKTSQFAHSAGTDSTSSESSATASLSEFSPTAFDPTVGAGQDGFDFGDQPAAALALDGTEPPATRSLRAVTSTTADDPIGVPDNSAEPSAPSFADEELPPFHGNGSAGSQASPSPQEVLQAAAQAAREYVAQMPGPVRVGLPLLLVGLTAAGLVAALSTDSNYVVTTQPLWAGPAGDGTFPPTGPVERGEKVEVIRRDGPFLLVRLPSLRVGYVSAAAIAASPPLSRPDEPFTRCRPRPGAVSSRDCHKRARTQRDSCLGFCEGSANPGECQDLCRDRTDECVLACDGVVADPAADETAAAGGPAAATVAPPTVVPEPSRSAPPTSRRKRKPKKGRKRKRRR